jgi:Family of unknown function (DUF6221)
VDELIAFLHACLDDDERVAREVSDRAPYDEWDATTAQGDDDAARSHAEVVGIARPHATSAARSIAEHIARWDPARVLAELKADRRILDLHRPVRADDVPGLVQCSRCGGEVMPCEHIRLLAQPYAGQPGWREEWAWPA